MTGSVVAVLGRGVVDPGQPVVLADDLGLSRGDGCFETCRAVTDPSGASHVDNLGAHLARLARSVRMLRIDVDIDSCRALVEEALAAWTVPGEAAVKLMVTRGVEGTGVPTVIATVHSISAAALQQRSTGVRVITLLRGTTAAAYTDADWLLGGVKSLSYAMNMAALREAAGRGADDVIWLSSDDVVLEGPTATVVWSAGDSLRTTPAGATGILAGTTVAALFDAASADGIDTGTADLRAGELPGVDAIWLVSSVRGVVEVVTLDGGDRARHGALTVRLRKYAGF